MKKVKYEMNKPLLWSVIFLFLPCICFALTADDNGYAWIAAGSEEKSAVCRQLAETNSKDSVYWVEMLDAFYGMDNWQIRSLKIKKVADQISLPEQPAGKAVE